MLDPGVCCGCARSTNLHWRRWAWTGGRKTGWCCLVKRVGESEFGNGNRVNDENGRGNFTVSTATLSFQQRWTLHHSSCVTGGQRFHLRNVCVFSWLQCGFMAWRFVIRRDEDGDEGAWESVSTGWIHGYTKQIDVYGGGSLLFSNEFTGWERMSYTRAERVTRMRNIAV